MSIPGGAQVPLSLADEFYLCSSLLRRCGEACSWDRYLPLLPDTVVNSSQRMCSGSFDDLPFVFSLRHGYALGRTAM